MSEIPSRTKTSHIACHHFSSIHYSCPQSTVVQESSLSLYNATHTWLVLLDKSMIAPGPFQWQPLHWHAWSTSLAYRKCLAESFVPRSQKASERHTTLRIPCHHQQLFPFPLGAERPEINVIVFLFKLQCIWIILAPKMPSVTWMMFQGEQQLPRLNKLSPNTIIIITLPSCFPLCIL